MVEDKISVEAMLEERKERLNPKPRVVEMAVAPVVVPTKILVGGFDLAAINRPVRAKPVGNVGRPKNVVKEPEGVELQRVEPKRVELTRVEPKRVELTKVEPKRVELTKVDPPTQEGDDDVLEIPAPKRRKVGGSTTKRRSSRSKK